MKQLSILICSITGREHLLQRLLSILLNGQWQHTRENYSEHIVDYYFIHDVEIIVYTDSKQISIGTKRNRLVKFSIGRYISFIDDDDTVEPDYIPLILEKINLSPDCVVFDAMRYVNGIRDKQVKYGVEYTKDFHDSKYYYRLPNHLMVFKKEIVLPVAYKDISFGEDSDFAQRVRRYILRQERIDKVLYHYLFTQQSTSTVQQKPRR